MSITHATEKTYAPNVDAPSHAGETTDTSGTFAEMLAEAVKAKEASLFPQADEKPALYEWVPLEPSFPSQDAPTEGATTQLSAVEMVRELEDERAEILALYRERNVVWPY